MSKIIRLGIDLGKNTFHVCAMDRAGQLWYWRSAFTQAGGWSQFLRTHEPCVVGQGGVREVAHHWARLLGALGYDAAADELRSLSRRM